MTRFTDACNHSVLLARFARIVIKGIHARIYYILRYHFFSLPSTDHDRRRTLFFYTTTPRWPIDFSRARFSRSPGGALEYKRLTFWGGRREKEKENLNETRCIETELNIV
jgi:hypothetical protein